MYLDTIAAISTALSESGIGIVRISGEHSFSVIDHIYRPAKGGKKLSEAPSHTIHYGYIVDGEETVDEVLVSIFRSPKSFTTEDTVEINCHGGIYATKRVLHTALKNGARLAEPGEFTKRAFLNGRIDLSQAESVIDVIQAKNEYALKSSLSQLRGSVLKAVEDLRSDILYQIARIESALDDPEHISLEGFAEVLAEKNREWMEKIQKLIDSAENGRLIKEGIKTVIVGKPNAGKSSLLNLLVGEERAIVTEIAGTTRDVLTESIQLDGLTLNLADTAGIHKTEDFVEKIGVQRAEETVRDADLILYVADSSTDLDENDERILRLLQGRKAIVLLNKTDLPEVTAREVLKEKVNGLPVLSVSAKEQRGIQELKDCIKSMFIQGELSFNDQVFITNVRQKSLLESSLESLKQVEESIALGMPEDFFSIDLTNACASLGEITGENVSEDLVNEIFSKFCMGK